MFGRFSRFSTTLPARFVRPSVAVFEFTSKRNLYENLTMRAQRCSGLSSPFKSFSHSFSIALSPNSAHTYFYTYTHTQTCTYTYRGCLTEVLSWSCAAMSYTSYVGVSTYSFPNIPNSDLSPCLLLHPLCY